MLCTYRTRCFHVHMYVFVWSVSQKIRAPPKFSVISGASNFARGPICEIDIVSLPIWETGPGKIARYHTFTMSAD